MFKYFTFKNTHNCIDVLDQLVYSYNHTYHSSIKRALVEVNLENERDAWLTLYGNKDNVERKPCAFKEGDTVRISKAKLTLEKVMKQIGLKNYSQERCDKEWTHCCGYYETSIDILNALRKHVKIQTNYDKHSKKAKLQLSNGATLKLSDRLSENLGSVPGKVSGENVVRDSTLAIESPFTADPHVDSYLLYIYTEIIQPEVLGGVFAPLLRILTVKGKDGDMIHEIFDRPHYCPVSRKKISVH
ncbi:hypothetical protein AVEN_69054-1 [Araneus ventricosus]|uniref:Uncharacterized protein n=1 Tax=Araneus ventricosus TaxID=182803 RepID=A0A4Y2VT77_ARAVE|nr:hypothetical protein AVEN_69054-1 [Araneus ventricosus]